MDNDLLESLAPFSEEETSLLNIIESHRLWPNQPASWEPLLVQSVCNPTLQREFIAKKNALFKKHLDVHVHYGFAVEDPKKITELCRKGPKTRTSKKNLLGDGDRGFSLWCYADICLKQALFAHMEGPLNLVVYQFIYGKRKYVTMNNGGFPLPPTPNCHSHVPLSRPDRNQHINFNVNASEVYLYCLDKRENTLPCRHCLPHAVVRYTPKEQVPRPVPGSSSRGAVNSNPRSRKEKSSTVSTSVNSSRLSRSSNSSRSRGGDLSERPNRDRSQSRHSGKRRRTSDSASDVSPQKASSKLTGKPSERGIPGASNVSWVVIDEEVGSPNKAQTPRKRKNSSKGKGKSLTVSEEIKLSIMGKSNETSEGCKSKVPSKSGTNVSVETEQSPGSSLSKTVETNSRCRAKDGSSSGALTGSRIVVVKAEEAEDIHVQNDNQETGRQPVDPDGETGKKYGEQTRVLPLKMSPVKNDQMAKIDTLVGTKKEQAHHKMTADVYHIPLGKEGINLKMKVTKKLTSTKADLTPLDELLLEFRNGFQTADCQSRGIKRFESLSERFASLECKLEKNFVGQLLKDEVNNNVENIINNKWDAPCQRGRKDGGLRENLKILSARLGTDKQTISADLPEAQDFNNNGNEETKYVPVKCDDGPSTGNEAIRTIFDTASMSKDLDKTAGGSCDEDGPSKGEPVDQSPSEHQDQVMKKDPDGDQSILEKSGPVLGGVLLDCSGIATTTNDNDEVVVLDEDIIVLDEVSWEEAPVQTALEQLGDYSGTTSDLSLCSHESSQQIVVKKEAAPEVLVPLMATEAAHGTSESELAMVIKEEDGIHKWAADHVEKGAQGASVAEKHMPDVPDQLLQKDHRELHQKLHAENNPGFSAGGGDMEPGLNTDLRLQTNDLWMKAVADIPQKPAAEPTSDAGDDPNMTSLAEPYKICIVNEPYNRAVPLVEDAPVTAPGSAGMQTAAMIILSASEPVKDKDIDRNNNENPHEHRLVPSLTDLVRDQEPLFSADYDEYRSESGSRVKCDPEEHPTVTIGLQHGERLIDPVSGLPLDYNEGRHSWTEASSEDPCSTDNNDHSSKDSAGPRVLGMKPGDSERTNDLALPAVHGEVAADGTFSEAATCVGGPVPPRSTSIGEDQKQERSTPSTKEGDHLEKKATRITQFLSHIEQLVARMEKAPPPRALPSTTSVAAQNEEAEMALELVPDHSSPTPGGLPTVTMECSASESFHVEAESHKSTPVKADPILGKDPESAPKFPVSKNNSASKKVRRTRPDTAGQFHGRTLLFGAEVPPRYIPLSPLYKKQPIRRSGNHEIIPIDPRPVHYQNCEKMRLSEASGLRLVPIDTHKNGRDRKRSGAIGESRVQKNTLSSSQNASLKPDQGCTKPKVLEQIDVTGLLDYYLERSKMGAAKDQERDNAKTCFGTQEETLFEVERTTLATATTHDSCTKAEPEKFQSDQLKFQSVLPSVLNMVETEQNVTEYVGSQGYDPPLPSTESCLGGEDIKLEGLQDRICNEDMEPSTPVREPDIGEEPIDDPEDGVKTIERLDFSAVTDTWSNAKKEKTIFQRRAFSSALPFLIQADREESEYIDKSCHIREFPPLLPSSPGGASRTNIELNGLRDMICNEDMELSTPVGSVVENSELKDDEKKPGVKLDFSGLLPNQTNYNIGEVNQVAQQECEASPRPTRIVIFKEEEINIPMMSEEDQEVSEILHQQCGVPSGPCHAGSVDVKKARKVGIVKGVQKTSSEDFMADERQVQSSSRCSSRASSASSQKESHRSWSPISFESESNSCDGVHPFEATELREGPFKEQDLRFVLGNRTESQSRSSDSRSRRRERECRARLELPDSSSEPITNTEFRLPDSGCEPKTSTEVRFEFPDSGRETRTNTEASRPGRTKGPSDAGNGLGKSSAKRSRSLNAPKGIWQTSKKSKKRQPGSYSNCRVRWDSPEGSYSPCMLGDQGGREHLVYDDDCTKYMCKEEGELRFEDHWKKPGDGEPRLVKRARLCVSPSTAQYISDKRRWHSSVDCESQHCETSSERDLREASRTASGSFITRRSELAFQNKQSNLKDRLGPARGIGQKLVSRHRLGCHGELHSPAKHPVRHSLGWEYESESGSVSSLDEADRESKYSPQQDKRLGDKFVFRKGSWKNSSFRAASMK